MPKPSARPAVGIQFPKNEKGDRSTSDAQKKIWAATFRAIDSETASQVENEKNWRHGYSKYIIKHVQESLASPLNAIQSAQAGLDELHNSFEFIREGETCTLGEAMQKYDGTFNTGFIQGSAEKPDRFRISVPYGKKVLQKNLLLQQLEKWKNYGTIEPSCADAISHVARTKGMADLTDQYFVLLGAGSAMGPLKVLLALGANVIAVDLNRPGIWKRLIGLAKDSCGTLTFPIRNGKKQEDFANDDELYENAGCDLIAETPEINNWLKSVYPEKHLTVGCYVYLDGEAHVRVVLACDAIMKGMCEARKCGIAFLCTPTDAHVIPTDALAAAEENYTSKGLGNLALLPIKTVFGKKYLIKNVQGVVEAQDGKKYAFVDGLVVAQGPNYALAKRMQHWRCIVAKNDGCIVSSNVAPSTSTASVVSNKQFAWAYDGMPYFTPLEIFNEDTSNAVMGALLIHDVKNEKSVSHPDQKQDNPLQLFSENAFHGGVWRCGYTVGSVGEVSVLIHFLKVFKFVFILLPILILILAVLIMFVF